MDVYKQPVTDPSKGSKRGQLSLRRNSDGFLETVERGMGKPEEVRPRVSLLILTDVTFGLSPFHKTCFNSVDR